MRVCLDTGNCDAGLQWTSKIANRILLRSDQARYTVSRQTGKRLIVVRDSVTDTEDVVCTW